MPTTLKLLTITNMERKMEGQKLAPVHPGEILFEEFLEPMQLSQYRLAKSLQVPPRRINEIIQGKRRISADTALRLAQFFGTSERFWMNLQVRYDLEVEKDRLGDHIAQIQPFNRGVLVTYSYDQSLPSMVGDLFHNK